MRRTWTVILVAAVLSASTITGCSRGGTASADNTADVCEQFFSTTTQFTKDSLEGRALSDAMLREYKGTIDEGEFQATLTAFNKAFGAALKPLADTATRPELKSALTRLATRKARAPRMWMRCTL